MKKTYWLVGLVILIIVGVGGFALVKNQKNNPGQAGKGFLSNFQSSSTQTPAPKPETLSYTHPDLGFTFNYPGQYTLTNLQDDNGETILVQNAGKGLQIYISKFEGKTITSADVRSSLKNEKLENLKDIQMPGGFLAVSFSSKNTAMGEVWDVWFVQNGLLYQITSEAGQDALLKKVVETFKWEENQ